ncbi:MAG: chromosomal replication initiator protein DnaA, partial [Candidatus Electrothrix sp. AR3]|nr:chromosomal replication initiator protein DnaA [Candidatus Electrothrix sp. AR3]
QVLEGLVNIDLSKQKQISAQSILELVSSQFRIAAVDLTSRSRKRAISFPRQIAMYLTRKYTEDSLAYIGKIYNRDHSTVMYAIKVINRDIAQKESVRQQLAILSDKLGK